MEQQHPVCGIASFIASIIAITLIFIPLIIMDPMVLSNIGVSKGPLGGITILGLFFFSSGILCLFALGLGVTGLIKKDGKKIFAILGTIFSAAILVMLSMGIIVGHTKHFDGARPWTFLVEVYSSKNMEPIPNASVSIVVANEEPFGEIESFWDYDMPIESRTGSNGLCIITAKFNSYGNESILIYEEFVNFRNRNLHVKAQGFEYFDAPLKTFIETPLKLKKNYKSDSTKTRIRVPLNPKG